MPIEIVFCLHLSQKKCQPNVNASKGQTKSKRFFQVDVSSKTRVRLYYYDTTFVFWRKLKTPKRHFEINRSLAVKK